MAAVLGGLDALVFTGGVADDDAETRRRLAADLARLDRGRFRAQRRRPRRRRDQSA